MGPESVIPERSKTSGFEGSPLSGKQWFGSLSPMNLGMPPKPQTGKDLLSSYVSRIEPIDFIALSY